MKNILQYFEKTCEQFPNHIAVANESSSVTFNDLKTRSQQAGTGYQNPAPALLIVIILL